MEWSQWHLRKIMCRIKFKKLLSEQFFLANIKIEVNDQFVVFDLLHCHGNLSCDLAPCGSTGYSLHINYL